MRTKKPFGKPLDAPQLALVTGGALNAYLYLKGQKSGSIKDSTSSDSGGSSSSDLSGSAPFGGASGSGTIAPA